MRIWSIKATSWYFRFFILLIPLHGSATECVVLLHGLGQITDSMAALQMRLENSGYTVAKIHYSPRHDSPREIAVNAVGRGIRECRDQDGQRIHFVTHSFGGILLRLYLQEHTLEELGRVVMLGPPNHGVEMLEKLTALPGAGLLSPSIRALGTGADSIVHELGPVDFELGVIAGSRNINPLSWLLQDGPNDSLVTVESTRVDGLDAHLVLPVVHNIMMRNNLVIDHTIHYLKTGSFMPG